MYGFIGAGELTAAIVTGLSTVADPPPVVLSPRGRDIARGLATRFPNVRVCASNQEVLDTATTVVLAVRPQIAGDVLPSLVFRKSHVVLSALAGVRLSRLRSWVSPAHDIVRAVPLPQAARRQSLTAVYPDHPAARELFDRVGDVLVPAEEPALEAFSAATATFAAHLDYLATIAAWLSDHGVTREAATTYTMHIFGQLGQSLSAHTDSLAALTDKHMTPGGINEQLLTELRTAGVPDTVRRALDRVLTRLRS